MQGRVIVLLWALLGVTLPSAFAQSQHPLDSLTAAEIQATTKVLSAHPSFLGDAAAMSRCSKMLTAAHQRRHTAQLTNRTAKGVLMKTWILASATSLVLISGTAFAQDPVKVAASHYTVVLENPSVRILKANVAPGAKTAMHSHPDSVVIPLAASKVRFTMADGKSQDSDLPSESAMYTPAHTHSRGEYRQDRRRCPHRRIQDAGGRDGHGPQRS